MNQRHSTLAIGTFFLLIASIFGILALHDGALYYDETITIIAIGKPYGYNNLADVTRIVTELSAQHPPGHYWFLAFWVRLVGYSEVALRASSFFFGVLGLAFIYRLGKDAINQNVGLLAMGLGATNTLVVFYFAEVRMYPMALLMLTVFLWTYLRVFPVERKPSRMDWLGLFLATLGLIYTHYIAIFTIFAVCLYHLLFVPKNRRWWLVVLTFGLAGLSFVPWLGVVIKGSVEATSPDLQNSAVGTSWLMAYVLGNGNFILASVSIVTLLVSGFVTKGKGRYLYWVFAISWLVFALVQQFRQIMPDFRARYLLLFYPCALILISATFTKFIRPNWGKVAVLALWGVSGILFSTSDAFWYYNNRANFRQENYPPYSAMITAFYRNGLPSSQDIVLAIAYDEPVYAIDDATAIYAQRLGTNMLTLEPSKWETMLTETFPNYITAPSIWWAYTDDTPQQDAVAAITDLIEESHQNCETLLLTQHAVMIRYGIKALPCDWTSNLASPIHYQQEAISVIAKDAAFDDDMLVIGTAWDVGHDVRLHQYSVALRVYDASGNFIADSNFELPQGYKAQHIAQIALMGNTDNAYYDIQMIVYDWQTGDKLTVSDTGSDITPLLTIHVAR